MKVIFSPLIIFIEGALSFSDILNELNYFFYRPTIYNRPYTSIK